MSAFRRALRGRRPISQASAPPDRATVERWLVDRVAVDLEVPSEAIDPTVPLAEFGLDSRATQRLAGDLETWLGRTLSPTLVWDYPTIAAVADHVTGAAEQPILAAS